MHASQLRLVRAAPANHHRPPLLARGVLIVIVGAVQAFAWAVLVELLLRGFA